MSIICFIGAWYCFKNGIDPGTDYFIIWALFAIADAILFGGGKRNG